MTQNEQALTRIVEEYSNIVQVYKDLLDQSAATARNGLDMAHTMFSLQRETIKGLDEEIASKNIPQSFLDALPG